MRELLSLGAAGFVLATAGVAHAEHHYPCKLDGLPRGKVAITDEGEVTLLDGDRPVAKATLSLPYNDAKGEVTCAGQKIEIYSQMPFSAAAVAVTLARKGGELVVTADDSGDPAAAALDQAEKLLKAGRIAEAVAELAAIEYPGHYFDEGKMAARVLLRAHQVAKKLHKGKDARGAADALTAGFGYYRDAAEGGVPARKLIGIQNDYGFFLDEAGDHARAEAELRAVVASDPRRAAAHLNLADALWALGKTHEAMVEYEAYAKRVPARKRPPRVAERLKGVS